MQQDGWRLAYETPVGGAPWSIPFEFPIYQAIVAAISSLFNTDLDRTGRALSFVSLAACVIPALQLQRRLNLSRETLLIFCCLLFSAPIYLYWGRTFMIETTAMFFTFAALPYFVDLVRADRDWRAAAMFGIWMTLGLLQKVTTALPLAAMLGIVWLVAIWRGDRRFLAIFSRRHILIALVAFAIPCAIGFVWTEYSSYVRSQNTLGSYLTNANLSQWNWGTAGQRISKQLWSGVLWERIFNQNLGGPLGVCLIAFAVAMPRPGMPRLLVILSALFGLVPFFTFTNLYIVHEYYPTACVIYLVAAIAVVLGVWVTQSKGSQVVAWACLAFIVGNSVYQFCSVYLPAAKYRHEVAHNQALRLGNALKVLTPAHSAILVYGHDWSSQVAYFAQRKSFTIPQWGGKLDDVWAKPESVLGGLPLGAIAVCNDVKSPTPAQVAARAGDHTNWDSGRLGNCTVLVRSSGPLSIHEGDPLPAEAICAVHGASVAGFPTGQPVDRAPLVAVDVALTGLPERDGRGRNIVLAVTQRGTIVRAVRAISIPTITSGFSGQHFSGMISTEGLHGDYDVVPVFMEGTTLASCLRDRPIRLQVSGPAP